jgi:hypothetical protein
MRGPVEVCKHEPCAACPWRRSNLGKPSPLVENQKYRWYTAANLKRLWAQLRKGDPMTCHPTDPMMRQATGNYVKDHTVTYECTGAVILQQREFQYLSDIIERGGSIKDYRRQHPRGLTADGAECLLARLIWGGTPLARRMGRPNLNEPDVQYAQLGVWQQREPRE